MTGEHAGIGTQFAGRSSEIRDLTREQSMLTEKGKARLCSAATISSVEKLVRFDQRTVMTVDQWDSSHDGSEHS